MLSKLNIVPRWVIFFIDVLACSFSFVAAFLIHGNFNIHPELAQQLIYCFYLNIIFSSIVFYLLKTFSGIVRYTGIEDYLRIIVATIIIATLFVVTDSIVYLTQKRILLPFAVVLIYFLLSFLFLSSYRILVKSLFEYAKGVKQYKQNVLVFGAGELGMLTKRAIDNDKASDFKVVAFIDDDPRKAQTKIDGLIIHAPVDLTRLVEDMEISTLIIAIQVISTQRKNELVDFCLEHKIKVQIVPPTKRWINGEVLSNQIKNINIEDLLERDEIQIDNTAIADQIKGKRVMITGAAGSIGSELVKQLSHFEPGLIILVDNAESALYNIELSIRDAFPDQKYVIFLADIRNKARLAQVFEAYKPHYVYHAAAYKHVPLMENHPSEAVLANVLGTKHAADLAVDYEVEKFVMVSTDKAVNPSNVMGASKRLAEIYTQSLNAEQTKKSGSAKKTRFITTRFGNVLGSNGSVIPLFKEQIENGGPVTVTHPDITRYFMTIPEACQLVIEAGSMGNGGEIFIFDMGKSVKIVDLAKKMIKLSGRIPGKHIDIVFSGLRPGEKLYEELLNTFENTQPTHHQKIMIAKVREYDFEEVESNIIALVNCVQNKNEMAVVKKMKEMVPEFISNNSIYEDLDVVQI